MKKVYLLASLMLSGSLLMAQVAQQPVQKNNDRSNQRASHQNINRDSQITIWESDFSDASDWSIGNEAGNTQDWVIGTAGPSGPFAIGDIASATAANGFALFDSDALCASQGLGTQNAWIQNANALDLSSYPNIRIEFEQNYRMFTNSITFLEVDSGNGVWNTILLNEDMSSNDESPNPEFISIDISEFCGGSSEVFFRFRYEGECDYAWMIDDLAIIEISQYSAIANKAWVGDIINSFEYLTTPVSQVKELVVGFSVTNNGAAELTDLVVTATVTHDGNPVTVNTPSSDAISLAANTSDTIWWNTGYTPVAEGSYSVAFDMAFEELADDADLTDNTFEKSLYTHADRFSAFELGETPTNVFGLTINQDQVTSDFIDVTPGMLGQVFVVQETEEFYGLLVNFSTNTYPFTTTAQEDVSLVVHEGIDGDIQDIDEIYEADDLEITDYMITEIEDGGITYHAFVFDSPVELEADKLYMIGFGSEGDEDNVRVAGNIGNDDFSTVVFGESTGGNLTWFNGYDYTLDMMISNSEEFNTSDDASTVSVAELSNGNELKLYDCFPNPADVSTTIQFTLEASTQITIEVTDLTGKVIDVINFGKTRVGINKHNFNTVNLSDGIYYYTLVTADARLTKKMVVTH